MAASVVYALARLHRAIGAKRGYSYQLNRSLHSAIIRQKHELMRKRIGLSSRKSFFAFHGTEEFIKFGMAEFSRN